MKKRNGYLLRFLCIWLVSLVPWWFTTTSHTPNSNWHHQEFLETAMTLRTLLHSSRIRMSALVLEWGCFNRTLLKRKEDLVAAQVEVGGGVEIYNQYPWLGCCEQNLWHTLKPHFSPSKNISFSYLFCISWDLLQMQWAISLYSAHIASWDLDASKPGCIVMTV